MNEIENIVSLIDEARSLAKKEGGVTIATDYVSTFEYFALLDKWYEFLRDAAVSGKAASRELERSLVNTQDEQNAAFNRGKEEGYKEGYKDARERAKFND